METSRGLKTAGADIIPITERLERAVVEIKYMIKLYEKNYGSADVKSLVKERIEQMKSQINELEKVLTKL